MKQVDAYDVGQHRFIILNPRKAKKRVMEQALSDLGPLRWRRLPFMSTKRSPDAAEAARTARGLSKDRGYSSWRRAVTTRLLESQYHGTRAYFERNPRDVAVCWNGLNGSRRVFMQAAKDAGARTLFFELSPWAGRVTVDPQGVNYVNGLPRQAAPYCRWAKAAGVPPYQWRKITETKSQRAALDRRESSAGLPPMDAPFVFVALQTPGDSQLRLFGDRFRTVEAYLEACIAAARSLPDGWHMRIKEHPTAPKLSDLARFKDTGGRAFFDNDTDTFAQVAAARAVFTVNSSVGLEAMLFEKPVVASGLAFWRMEDIATAAPDGASLREACAMAPELSFDPGARDAFLSFLDQVYYVKPETAAPLIADRLRGPDQFGFWQAPDVDISALRAVLT